MEYAMEKRNFLVKKSAVLFAAALLAISAAGASAETRKHQQHQEPAYGAERSSTNAPESDTAGERSSTNVQDAVGAAGYAAPHEVPENGGAASIVQPGSTPSWR
jgi:hypothetical protein